MNIKKKLAVACPLLIICLILMFSTLSVGPSRIQLVMANPGEFGDSKVVNLVLKVWEDGTWRDVTFNENLQTRYAEVGEKIELLRGQVWIDKEYASTAAEAVANTRVHITVKNPAAETELSTYASMGPEGWVTEQENYFTVPYIAYASPYIELTEGTWTLTTKYEIFA